MEPELTTLKDQPDELQKDTRNKFYAEKIGAKKRKPNTIDNPEKWTLFRLINNNADEITKKIEQLSEYPENVVMSETEDFNNIILEMERLQKSINSYNTLPPGWITPSYAPLPPIFISSKIPLNEPVAKKKRKPKKKFKNKRLRKLKKIK